MATEKPQTAKLIFSLTGIAFTALIMFAMFGPESCGPSEEERQLLATLNNLDEVVQKGAHIKTVTSERGDKNDDDVYRFEAELLDEKGVAIGKLRGGRVEGFGTMKPRFLWYKTPGVPEDWPPRPEGGRRGDRGR